MGHGRGGVYWEFYGMEEEEVKAGRLEWSGVALTCGILRTGFAL
jgi:hypothetical protein